MQERFSMKDLLRHKDIVIQCHDFPDADTIATAFAVYEYLKMYDNYAKIIFSGKGQIVKPALIKMVQQLKIPIEYVETPPPVKTLITVDCQYGAGNVTHIDAEKVFIIDHHEDKNLGLDGEIRSQLGSCATLVWDLLVAEGFPIMKNLATALYYGLYTDTGGFDEIGHPLDRDMRDTLSIDKAMLDSLRYSSFTLSELTIAGTALIRHNVNTHYKFAIFRSEPCDPNILGFINDLALQTEGLDVCIVYAHVSGGYKLSVRSCTRTTMANELASFLAGGGGHRQKAGGFIPQCDVENIDQFLEARTLQYFEQYDMVEAANHDLDVFSMAAYKKLNISVAYARSEDCFP
ncbi:MAG: DHH family phosphoesterase, partial [Defluviitaleaceae bacterium]|nr:DHH family phosphoesterase [Defluviitaleaceae bacterium]